MDFQLLRSGLTIGLSIAAPIGANGLLCINRSLLQGTLTEFVSGLGAASAHLLYSSIAGLGLGFISGILTGQEFLLKTVGGLFLCYLGIKIFLKKTPKKNVPIQKVSLKTAYLSTLLLALTNPQTVFSFLGLFSSAGVIEPENSLSAAIMLVGVFLGSAFWWLFVSVSVSSISKWVTPKRMRYFNFLSGVAIVSFGLKTLFSLSA